MHGGEEDKRSSGKNACPQSVEKVWFTDTSTGELGVLSWRREERWLIYKIFATKLLYPQFF